jgi:hypothetical protein
MGHGPGHADMRSLTVILIDNADNMRKWQLFSDFILFLPQNFIL